jgi:hypothetical protein
LSDIQITPRYPPSYVDGMVNVLLMGAGAHLVTSHAITQPMLNAGVGAVITLFNLAYMAVTLNPSKQSPIQALMGLVARSRNGALWNSSVNQIELVLGQRAGAEARKVAGPIFGPLAARAARDAVQAASKSFLYPQP